MSKKQKNVTITNLSERQYGWLSEQAEFKAMTMTGIVKMMIESEIKQAGDQTNDNSK